MTKAAKQAWVCWAVAAAGLALALRLALGPAGSPAGAGEAFGRLAALTGAAAFATWYVARRRAPAWSWMRFGATYVLAVLLLALLSAFGRARADDLTRAFPLTLDTPLVWTSEQLEGSSSAPKDLHLGRRLRQQWHGAEGDVVLEATCIWLDRVEYGAPGALLAEAQRSIGAAYAEQGVDVTPSAIRSVPSGGREWQVAELELRQQETPVLRMRIAMARSPRCGLSIMYAGPPAAFAAQEARFDAVLAGLKAD